MPPEERPSAPDVWTWLGEIAIAAAIFVVVVFLLGYYFQVGYGWYGAIIERLYDFWASIRTVIMVVVVLVSIGLVGFMVVIYRRFYTLKMKLPLLISGVKGITAAKPAAAEKEIANEWEEVKKLGGSENPSDWNMAVLRADSLLDEVLQYLGHEGTTVRERLDKVDPTMVPSIDRLSSVHRLRNIIAHDPTIPHTKETLAQALRSYEQGFRELGVLKEG